VPCPIAPSHRDKTVNSSCPELPSPSQGFHRFHPKAIKTHLLQNTPPAPPLPSSLPCWWPGRSSAQVLPACPSPQHPHCQQRAAALPFALSSFPRGRKAPASVYTHPSARSSPRLRPSTHSSVNQGFVRCLLQRWHLAPRAEGTDLVVVCDPKEDLLLTEETSPSASPQSICKCPNLPGAAPRGQAMLPAPQRIPPAPTSTQGSLPPGHPSALTWPDPGTGRCWWEGESKLGVTWHSQRTRAQWEDPECLGLLQKEAAPGNGRSDRILLPRGVKGCPRHLRSSLLQLMSPLSHVHLNLSSSLSMISFLIRDCKRSWTPVVNPAQGGPTC